MLSSSFLEKIGFSPVDISEICSCDAPYTHELDALADAFMHENGQRGKVPYTQLEYQEKRERAHSFLMQAAALCQDYHVYMAHLLFWLHCVPHAKLYYATHGINEAVFWDSMYDLVCKTEMCKKNYGRIGVYLDWFYLFFDYLLFGLGRLQFFIERFERECYRFGDFELRKGDTVYSCHIPANGKLSIDCCFSSFQNAYDFFKDDLSSSVIPITCESWLLYPPYVQKVFAKDSNIARFAALFDIVSQHSTGRRFLDARNVFGRFIDSDTSTLPQKTNLQRSFIHFIEEGNDFGSGYGIILYDGVERRILNHHHF